MRRNQPEHREDALSILHGHRVAADVMPQEFTEFGYWIDRQLARLEARYYRPSEAQSGRPSGRGVTSAWRGSMPVLRWRATIWSRTASQP